MDEREELQVDPRERRPGAARRIVESSSYAYSRPGLSFATKALLALGTALTVGVGVLAFVLGPTLQPTVSHAIHALSGWGWLWLLLLVITAIGGTLGLLRKFGLVQLLEDLVELGLRIHQHVINSKRLHADKIGNYPILINEQGMPLYIAPGNPAFAPQIALPAGSSRRANKQQAGVQQTETVNEGMPSTQQPALPAGPASPSTAQTMTFDQPQGLQHSPSVSIWGEEEQQGFQLATVPQYRPKVLPGPYDLAEEFEEFQPSAEGLFMGRADYGPLLLPLGDMWHIIMTGPTGGGKSIIRRMIMAQLQGIGAYCYLSDIHYFPVDEETGLDWTPIEERLAAPLMRDIETTYEFVDWLARGELQARIDRKYLSQPLGPAIFVFIEELPAVTDEKKEIVPLITKLLREGRKYKICFCGAAQDVLVKTIGASSGVRENIRTGFYTGGDPISARVILDLQSDEKIDDNGLGAGIVYAKTVRHRATKVRIPWPSNEAVTQLLEHSPLPVRPIEHVIAPRPTVPADQPAKLTLVKNERSTMAEDDIEAAFHAWVDGASSIQKLEKTLNITHYRATQLYNELKRRELIS